MIQDNNIFVKYTKELRRNDVFRLLSTSARFLYISLLADYNLKDLVPVKITIRKMMYLTDYTSGKVQSSLAELLTHPELLDKIVLDNEIFFDFPLIRKSEELRVRKIRAVNAREIRTSEPQISKNSDETSKKSEDVRETSTTNAREIRTRRVRETRTEVRGKSARANAEISNPETNFGPLRNKNYIQELEKEERARNIIKDIDIDYEAELERRANDPNRQKQRSERFIILPQPKRDYNPLVNIVATMQN